MLKIEDKEKEQLIQKNAHLKQYIDKIQKKMKEPVFYSELPYEIRFEEYPNLIYLGQGSIFIHIFKTRDMDEVEYHAIEPTLDKNEQIKYDQLQKLIVKLAPKKESVVTDDELKKVLYELSDEIIEINEKAVAVKTQKKNRISKLEKLDKIKTTSLQKKNIEYFLIKNLIGGGPLECFMRDPYLEDIHVVSGHKVHLTHKVFGMIKTNIEISNEEGHIFIRKISEKMGTPVSEGQPIVDGVLPDGSRGNIIYSDAISLKGPSMTIRRFSETPISITQLIKWGTIGSNVAAYLWLCIQYGRSFFICGGTACGKTTTMNSLIPFIPPDKKIYTAEQTPELQVPHTVWQRLLTKTTGPKEAHVDLFDLLKAALRSRPDYIIPGEVRGAEGSIVFQAMQTGHPCITTFHAGSVRQVIQRFTGEPINVPKTFMDNLDFVMIQLAVNRNGKLIRRMTSIDEIEGYNREVDGIMSRNAFEWDPVEDVHHFRANKNSYILEEKIAKNAGYTDSSEIYLEFEKRKLILERMIEEDIMDYYEVVQFIWSYYREGDKGIPIIL